MAELIKENELRVNQVVRSAFSKAGQPLTGSSLYILAAMLWGIENGAADWADANLKYKLEDAIGAMLSWDPKEVMSFMFYDEDGFSEQMMTEGAGSLEGDTPEDIAQSLLETLDCELD